MKTYLFLLLSTIFSISLSAQPLAGKWTDSNKAEDITIQIRPTPKGGVVFEVETTIMKARGLLSDDGTILTFKNSDGILQLRRLQNPGQFQNKRGHRNPVHRIQFLPAHHHGLDRTNQHTRTSLGAVSSRTDVRTPATRRALWCEPH